MTDKKLCSKKEGVIIIISNMTMSLSNIIEITPFGVFKVSYGLFLSIYWITQFKTPNYQKPTNLKTYITVELK